MNHQIAQSGQADASAEHQHSRPQPKWAADIEDQYIPSPERKVKVRVLKDQASIAPDNVLVRDQDGENDVPLNDDQVIDLAAGNVFYAVPACDAPKPANCQQIPKLAFFVDDRLEITMRANQTGATLRELFGFTPEVQLFRDFESPHDEPIGPDQAANFADGPVFYTRRKHAKLTIFVNEKPFTEAEGVKHEMTGREIAQLVFSDPNNYSVYQLPGDKELPLDQKVKVHDCEKFKVIRKTVSGGFEMVRVERELVVLRQGGAKVSFIPEVPAVVYHDVPARKDYPHLQSSDVLVVVPGGYPGQFLDGAYLPQGSPLLGRVAGNPQNVTVRALDRTWQLVSYHPHNGGGGPPWNKDKHGFHTYIDELLTWVHLAKI
jgi:hypothetical protein